MDFIQSTSGGIVMAIGGLFAYLMMLLWARQPNKSHRLPILITATGMGVIVFLANQFARAFGLWDWWGYALPLVVQAGLLFILPSIFFTFIVMGYHWLAAHSQHPYLWYGLIGVIVLVPLTVFGDLYNLARGKLAFSRGYTLWQDILLGQAFFWLPVFLYQFVQRKVHQTSV